MEPNKTGPLNLHGTPGATAILLRQYFFALRLLEEGPHKIKGLKSVQSLLGGMEAAHERPLVRVRIVPGRLDGVFFCRALGKQQTPTGEPTSHAARQESFS